MPQWSGEPANLATNEHAEIRWITPDGALGLDLAHDSYTDALRTVMSLTGHSRHLA
nr:hypothetical protein [Arthrobacter sp. SO5]